MCPFSRQGNDCAAVMMAKWLFRKKSKTSRWKSNEVNVLRILDVWLTISKVIIPSILSSPVDISTLYIDEATNCRMVLLLRLKSVACWSCSIIMLYCLRLFYFQIVHIRYGSNTLNHCVFLDMADTSIKTPLASGQWHKRIVQLAAVLERWSSFIRLRAALATLPRLFYVRSFF